jgi:microsomal epoxide hydrolase
MLADPGAYGGDARDAFDVVVPSLPGHGFSDAPLAVGFGADQCADVVHTLMTDVLGFDRFVTQGGDRGAFVSAGLGHRHRPSITGVHLNMATGIVGAGDEISEDELRFQRDQMSFLAREGGYIAIQGTRPQTLGVGLNDSPVGLLAWIVEKWYAWSDCNGDIESCFTKDELLTNVMLYWITQTIRPSMHYYYEHRATPPVAMRPERIDVPTAVAMFPREVMQVPRSAVERKYDLRRWTTMAHGGHFAAMEQPDALVADIRAFCREFR